MVAQVLAPATAAGKSSDVTVTAGSTNTVALYGTVDDSLSLVAAGDLLLVDGVSKLLLVAQSGDNIPSGVTCKINLKDPNGEYRHSGLILRGSIPFQELGPGIWQVEKPVTSIKIGVQSE
jgi:hypothetical protein